MQIKVLHIPDKRPFRITHVSVEATAIGQHQVLQIAVTDAAESGTAEVVSPPRLIANGAVARINLRSPNMNWWPVNVDQTLNCLSFRSSCLNYNTTIAESAVIATVRVTVQLGPEQFPSSCNVQSTNDAPIPSPRSRSWQSISSASAQGRPESSRQCEEMCPASPTTDPGSAVFV